MGFFDYLFGDDDEPVESKKTGSKNDPSLPSNSDADEFESFTKRYQDKYGRTVFTRPEVAETDPGLREAPVNFDSRDGKFYPNITGDNDEEYVGIGTIQDTNQGEDGKTERTVTNVHKEVQKKIKPNSLSDFDNWTYKWTWFMAPPEDVYNQVNPIDPRLSKSRVILAESGTSARLHISDVEIESLVMPNFRISNSQVNTFDMTIMEPKGFAFMEMIFGASIQLGIPNYMFAPYFLALDFIVYDDDGVPQKLENGSKIYSIKILNITMNSTSEGSTYSIRAVEMEHLTMSNQSSIMTHNYKIQASTVGQFFNRLQEKINEEYEKTRFLTREIPDKIRFDIDPEIASMPTTSMDDHYDPQNLSDDQFYAGPEQVFNVPKGMDVGSILNHLMAANESWVKKYIAPELEEPYQEKQDFSKIWHIDTDMNILGFDYYVNNYAHEYIFRIHPYTSIRKLENPGTLSLKLNNKNEMIRRTLNIFKTFVIDKKYDYFYTGTNTEVLNFDIDMNFVWTGVVPLYHGIKKLNFSDTGSEVKTSKQDLNEVKKKIEALEEYRSRFSRAPKVGSLDARSEELTKSRQELQKRGDEIRSLRDQITSDEAEKLRDLADQRKSRGITYAEDLLVGNKIPVPGGKDGESEREPYTGNNPLPYTAISDGGNPEINSSLLDDGTRKPFRTIAGTILSNIFYQTKDLLEITINIKGDPYWLGITRVENRLKGVTTKTFKGFANTYIGDNLFALNFRIPTLESDEDGLNKSIESNVISGIYAARSIVSRFSEGQFTQTITAHKDPQTNWLLSLGGTLDTTTVVEEVVEEPVDDTDQIEKGKQFQPKPSIETHASSNPRNQTDAEFYQKLQEKMYPSRFNNGGE